MRLDGSLIDMGSGLAAIAAVLIRLLRQKRARKPFDPGVLIVDGLNGAALVPFLVLMASLASTDVLRAIEHASRGTFFLAGLIGSIWIVGELRRP